FADIPGLIEGAHEGVGLGFDFLRHIERCFLLLHLISLDPNDNADIVQAYETIVHELSAYKQSVADKPIIIVANKIDAIGAEENLALLKDHLKDQDVIVISALNYTNIKDMLDQVIEAYLAARHKFNIQAQNNSSDQLLVWKDYSIKEKVIDKTIVINQVDEHVFEISGPYLKYWTHRIPLNTQDNLIRFNQKLQSINFKEQLKEAGAVPGDSLIIYDIQLEYEE
ncbi:Obg family GTPase CgtA, partial [Ureaplasma diversum]|uniref:Obg family GTPase CgtA n=1 Tax=Ureaplasma diversum TaxID=42094 RepID=UPI00056DBA18